MIDLRALSEEELDRVLVEKIRALPAEKQAALLEWIKKEFPESEEHEKGDCSDD